MAAEEHSACRCHFGPPEDDLASVWSIRSICLDLLDRRAAVSTCSRQWRNLSSLCNPAGRFGPFLFLVPHQAGFGEGGLYFLETSCPKLLQKGYQTAFLAPLHISAASPHGF